MGLILREMKTINNDFEFIACPICGGMDLKLLSKKGQFGLDCYVSICKNDGLVFLSPRWTKNRYEYYYKYKYYYDYRTKILGDEIKLKKYCFVILK